MNDFEFGWEKILKRKLIYNSRKKYLFGVFIGLNYNMLQLLSSFTKGI